MPEAALAEAPKPVAEPVKQDEQPKKLPGSSEHFSVSESSFAYADVDATMPVGHTIEDALKPEYWALHAHKMKKPTFSSGPDWSGAIINLRTQDHALYAQLYVRAVREKGLVVALLGEPVYFGLKEVKSDLFKTRWNFGKKRHDVIRKSDGEVVYTADTKEAAQDWIKETLGTA